MKRCPECRRDYYDDTLLYCLDDGNELLEGPASGRSEPGAVATGFSADEPQTAILHSTAAPGEAATRAQINTTDETAILYTAAEAEPQGSLGDSSEKHSFSANGAAKPLLAAVVAAVLLVSGFFGYRYFSSTDSNQINSIAVLPFENRSASTDTEYLSDGLADSLIYRLSQLPNLKVSPTSSVMRYKGKGSDTSQIAKELNVDAVMTGRLVQIGENLSISVQLTDARTDKLIWAEQYDRKMADLLATQREIATTITQKLQLKLSGEGEQKLTKKYTENNEAYQLYLRGQYHLARRSKDDLEKALEFYEQAIKLDPNFALAYVGISYTYNTGTGNNFLPVSNEEGFSRAKNAAMKARELDPDLAEAHTALGMSLRSEWKWSEAEREFKKALEMEPNNANTHYYYGLLLQNLGRTGDSLREIKTALELEPMSLIMQANLAGAYLFDRQYENAVEQAKRTFDLDPNFISARFWLAYAYCSNKQYDEAIALVDAAPKDETTQRLLARFLGYAYAKTGRRKEAEAVLAKYSSDPAFLGGNAAIIYGALGDKDSAFAALEKSIAAKADFSRMKVDPLFDDLRVDPRFKDLLNRIGLPE
ncbi:MAG TPA: tetratricopeptide repeat protein [Pyrinomonadaceae bacterium]|nr:tetratricopeptide repeat protein [Pyrinomonadaceae bacterium]